MGRISLKAHNGDSLQFDPDMQAGSGGMKDVFFNGPDRKYVVGWYKKPQDVNAKQRIDNIVGRYRQQLFETNGGDYWKDLFCWPTHMVEHNGKLGVVLPTYNSDFFFEHGSQNNDMLKIKGKEKEGKWFASASHQQKYLEPKERGGWINYIQMCIKLARATRKMHLMGLAHSDLSYKNCLVAPTKGKACLIDLDGLVVPGKFPPDVVGTPDFIAPEVMSTLGLKLNDPKRKLPTAKTDLHALAVLIYMYLLYRHPLRGRKIHDQDPAKDEELTMGANALFVENPSDSSNKPNPADCKKGSEPFCDVDAIPYSITGPYLKGLFEKAFIDGLHNPAARPTAGAWETALVKTVDLLQKCINPNCQQQWYAFNNTNRPKCPFCGTAYNKPLPVLDIYYRRDAKKDSFRPKNHRLMVYDGTSLFKWHLNNSVVPNEKLSAADKKRVGYFQYHQGTWALVNENIPNLAEIKTDGSKTEHAIGSRVSLTNGLKLLFDPKDHGHLVNITMANV
jgi:serine/threonine protein kinase